MSINKPTRSNRKANSTSNTNNANGITPEALAAAMAILKAAGMDIPNATAETPAAKPKHESAPFHGGKIWISNASGRAWIDGDIDLNELRKAFEFKADEYKPKKSK